jgi:hypothetical protein
MWMNADKPAQWKIDVAYSVNYYNQWFLEFAPLTYQQQRQERSGDVLAAFGLTEFLRTITPEVLLQFPSALQVLRMCTAPPLARDRLIGLASVRQSLVGKMERDISSQSGRATSFRDNVTIKAEYLRICSVITRLIDNHLFPWLTEQRSPTEQELVTASSRLTGAVADPIVRNAQEARQLELLERWLIARGYRHETNLANRSIDLLQPGSFAYRVSVPVGSPTTVQIPVDCLVMPRSDSPVKLPILIEAKSAGDFTNTNKRRKEEAQKHTQLLDRYADGFQFILLLCGYFDAGYLGYEAAEGIDWVWEHRLDDLEQLLGTTAELD